EAEGELATADEAGADAECRCPGDCVPQKYSSGVTWGFARWTWSSQGPRAAPSPKRPSGRPSGGVGRQMRGRGSEPGAKAEGADVWAGVAPPAPARLVPEGFFRKKTRARDEKKETRDRRARRTAQPGDNQPQSFGPTVQQIATRRAL